MHNNNDKTVNWISLVISNLADKDSIVPWSEESICTISSSQPPISQEEIISVTPVHYSSFVNKKQSNWLQVFSRKGGAHNLISLLGTCFHSFGIPETLTSDGGPEYIAGNTKEFLKKLGIHHRLSSVGFPHANQKAERSVGKAKRVIRDAVKPNGELDPVPLIKGLLTMRNTPDQDRFPPRNQTQATYQEPYGPQG